MASLSSISQSSSFSSFSPDGNDFGQSRSRTSTSSSLFSHPSSTHQPHGQSNSVPVSPRNGVSSRNSQSSRTIHTARRATHTFSSHTNVGNPSNVPTVGHRHSSLSSQRSHSVLPGMNLTPNMNISPASHTQGPRVHPNIDIASRRQSAPYLQTGNTPLHEDANQPSFLQSSIPNTPHISQHHAPVAFIQRSQSSRHISDSSSLPNVHYVPLQTGVQAQESSSMRHYPTSMSPASPYQQQSQPRETIPSMRQYPAMNSHSHYQPDSPDSVASMRQYPTPISPADSRVTRYGSSFSVQ